MVRLLQLLLLIYVSITEQKVYQCDSNSNCGCSQNPVSINALRIVNGETAGVNTLSWATFLVIGRSLCGGALISDSYIITAGHCVTGASASAITAYVGSIYAFGGQSRSVSRIYLHPQYYVDRSNKPINDIALLKLSRPLNMDDRTLAKICLPKTNTVQPDNSDVVAIGWGVTREGSQVSSETLQQVTLNVIGSNTDWCKSVASNMTTQFCAGIMPYGGKDTCQGDSGGPLMAFNDKNLWEVQGIVSYGSGCARPNKPGVYTRVGFYLNWIESVMSDASTITMPKTIILTVITMTTRLLF